MTQIPPGSASRQHTVTVWLGALGLTLIAAGLIAAFAPYTVRTMDSGTLRLRVIANSNTPADQKLKVEVRDVVLAVLGPGLVHATSSSAARTYVQAQLPAIQAAAEEVVRYAHSNEAVHVTLGNAPFPAKHLGTLRFASGTYPALVITIGSGAGHNWWTLLFPPLTFVTVDNQMLVVGQEDAGATLTSAQRKALLEWVSGRTGLRIDPNLLTSDGQAGVETVEVRFFIWEVLQELAHGGRVNWQGLLAWLN